MENNSSKDVLGVGSYQLKLRTGRILLLEDVRYAPTVWLNLLSVTALIDNGFFFNFRGNKLDKCLVDILFGHGFRMDSPFQLDLIDSQSSYSYVVNDNIVNDFTNWHERLDHIGQDRMTRLAREGLLGPLTKVNLQTCEACLAGKACRKPFGKAVRATQPLELVHSGICGPMSVKARHGASYFLTLIDDYTRYGYVIGDTSKNLDLYELKEVEATLPSPSEGWELVSHPVVAEYSISDPHPSKSTPPGPSGQQDSQLRRGARGRVPRHHFEIDGEILMCTPTDEDEPIFVEEALSSSTSNEWMSAMKDELSSMEKNQTGSGSDE
ncbi:hypothetical protein RJ640_005874 [Escallonia rubra]|uniref:GAG-pre-integrase domain-containing protein n=1 Tax=Escallonia rubra TaxID=112253 RepID=A0AA88S0L0_9ASTE|nr:hypothetical protein RJ640_005874 [Escallonia rubra]